jgi:hypothetical protein
MELLKRHYEKLLLGLVLLGLAVAVAFLPFKITSEKQSLEEARTKLTTRAVKPLTNLDLTLPEAAVKRVGVAAALDLASTNKLFNPMPWQRAADDRLIKVDNRNIGPQAVVITKTSPLFLTLVFDSVTVLEAGPKYQIGIQKEAAPTAAGRSKKTLACSLNVKNDIITLREVKGKPDDPVQVVVEISGSEENVVLSKGEPYKKVDGHMADLRYPPENKTWNARRVGSSLSFNNEEYNIVAISQNEVVLSAKSNQKKWTVSTTSTNNIAPVSNPTAP